MSSLLSHIESLGGSIIPDSVWDCPSLTPTDVKLYKVLVDYYRLLTDHPERMEDTEGNPIINVSQATLADKVRVSTKTLQGCIDRLKSVKLIFIDGNRGFKKNNLITLIGDFFGVGSEKKTERRQKVMEKEIKRVPIKLPKTKESYTEKLKELGGLTYSEKAILAISKHYNMLASRFNHIPAYNSLSKRDPKNHKNWKAFEKLYDLCTENGWDANLYLEAQFDRAKKYWANNRIKYPLPKMLCSENSTKYFNLYLEERKAKYAFDVGNKHNVKAQKTESIKKKLIKDVVRSAEFLSMYIREDVSELEKAEDKAVRLFHSWESYSPAYLWTVPWFKEFLKEVELAKPDNKRVIEVKEEFLMIDRSKSLQEVILKATGAAEKAFGVPGNIAI